MKFSFIKFVPSIALVCFSLNFSGQTVGTLTFKFTEVAKSPTYNGNSQHVLAAWVQTSAGAFVKTKLRYAGGGTSDHLPTWSVNAGGTAGNCLAAGANVVDATTGATRSSWTSYTVIWNGEMGPAASGTVQPDGIYKISIQSTWNHGTGGTAVTSFTFTKGPAIDSQTPANTTNYTGIQLDWVPSSPTGLESNSLDAAASIYPNPTTGVFTVNYLKASSIKVTNTLGMVVYSEKIEESTGGQKNIDLSNFAEGIYMINITNSSGSSNHKIILSK